MKNFKNISNKIIIVFLFLIIFFSVGMILFPDTFIKIAPFKLHAILTDSMESKIPVDSLVVAGSVNNIEKDDIILFEANEPTIDPDNKIVIAHYFKNTYVENGVTYYQTYNEKSGLDNYKIIKDDIIGSYKFHIPYIGKFFLFIKSDYGFSLLMQFIIIYVIYKYFSRRLSDSEDY